MEPNTLLLGRGTTLARISADRWKDHLRAAPVSMAKRLAFMTRDHRAVRESAVVHLPGNRGGPLSVRQLSRLTGVLERRMDDVLNDLQRNLFFLVRNRIGDVSWAFPVTVDRTPHAMTFSTGERLWAACAEDAMATPFVQGRLGRRDLTVRIDTHCAHCRSTLQLDVDHRLTWTVRRGPTSILVFEPEIVWSTFTAPTIVNDY